MTIVFPCECGKCVECWMSRPSFVLKDRSPIIFASRMMMKHINSWAKPEYPTTPEESVVTNESHDQKKSRLKKHHLEGMHKALHKWVGSGNRIR